MTATQQVSMSWVLWGQLPSLQRAACKIRLLGQGDWMVPLEIQSLDGVLWISDKSFLSSLQNRDPKYYLFCNWASSELEKLWNVPLLPNCPVFLGAEICSHVDSTGARSLHHTHLRWNTSCVGTALFLTVLFQDVSDLYLLPQQLCPWTLVWLEAGRGKCDVTALLQPL